MSDPRILTEGGWKTIAAKFKVKDNGLQKALAAYEKFEEDEHDQCLKGIATVTQLATGLKKSKEVAAAPDAMKYLTDLLNAAQTEAREVAQAKAKAKALAEKADIMEAKADAAKAKADAMEARAEAKAAEEEEKAKEEEEDEDEDEEGGDLLEKLKKSLKNLRSARDDYHFVICQDKPYGLVISKTPINAQHKKQLQEIAAGSKKYMPPGRCRLEGGTKLIFEMPKPPPPGFARVLQKWIKTSTGLAFKVTVGGQSDEDEEEPPLTGVNPELQRRRPAPDEPVEEPDEPTPASDEPPLGGVKPKAPSTGKPAAEDTGSQLNPDASAAAKATPENATGPIKITGSVGQRGKNNLPDVQAVQGALNRVAKAGLGVDGKCGGATIGAIKAFQKSLGMPYPDGLIEPGNLTERALNGEKVTVPKPKPAATGAGAKAGGGAAGAAAKAGAAGAANGGGGGFLPGIGDMLKKMAQEAAEQKRKAEKLYKEAIAKLNEAAKAGGGEVVSQQLKDELEKAYRASQDHVSDWAQAMKDAAKRQDEAAVAAVKSVAEGAFPMLRTLEGAAGQVLRTLGL